MPHKKKKPANEDSEVIRARCGPELKKRVVEYRLTHGKMPEAAVIRQAVEEMLDRYDESVAGSHAKTRSIIPP